MSSGLILTASERSATACCATPKDLDGLSLLLWLMAGIRIGRSRH